MLYSKNKTIYKRLRYAHKHFCSTDGCVFMIIVRNYIIANYKYIKVKSN